MGIEEKGEGGHRRDLEEKMEKAMAPHSSTLAWKIPCTEESGGLQSMGLKKESDTTKQLNNKKQL